MLVALLMYGPSIVFSLVLGWYVRVQVNAAISVRSVIKFSTFFMVSVVFGALYWIGDVDVTDESFSERECMLIGVYSFIVHSLALVGGYAGMSVLATVASKTQW